MFEDYLTGNFTMPLDITAIHEAGHAVVAAYLRLPLTHVSMRSRNIASGGSMDGYCRIRSATPRSAQGLASNWQRRAVTTLAARAAVDKAREYHPSHFASDINVELGYTADENFLLNVADHLGVKAVDIDVWRASLLKEAETIVRLPPVWFAITGVATELLTANRHGRGLPGKRVREILWWSEGVDWIAIVRKSEELQALA